MKARPSGFSTAGVSTASALTAAFRGPYAKTERAFRYETWVDARLQRGKPGESGGAGPAAGLGLPVCRPIWSYRMVRLHECRTRKEERMKHVWFRGPGIWLMLILELTCVGATRYVVTAIANNTRMTVTPVPETSGTGLAYKIGDDQLKASTPYVRLTLGSALSQAFYVKTLSAIPGNAIREKNPTLNDAIAKVATSGTISSADYFDSDVSQLVESPDSSSNPFPAAYAEYLPLGVSAVPVPRAMLSTKDGH